MLCRWNGQRLSFRPGFSIVGLVTASFDDLDLKGTCSQMLSVWAATRRIAPVASTTSGREWRTWMTRPAWNSSSHEGKCR
jgi:hypothetical protein